MGEKNERSCVLESSENGCAKSMTSVCIPSQGIVAGERGESAIVNNRDSVIHPRVEISSALPLGDYVIRASCLLLPPPPVTALSSSGCVLSHNFMSSPAYLSIRAHVCSNPNGVGFCISAPL